MKVGVNGTFVNYCQYFSKHSSGNSSHNNDQVNYTLIVPQVLTYPFRLKQWPPSSLKSQ